MRSQAGRIVLALVLILFGVVALLGSLGVVDLPLVITGPNFIWAVLFGVSGLAFIITFFSGRENWWAIIPGLTLLGLGILVAGVIPPPYEAYSGVFFMGCMALSFWIVFLTHPENWWAIIPGGVLLSITALIFLTQLVDNGLLGVGVMFLGMGATFLLVYLFAKPVARAIWPLFPAGILGVMGVLFLIGAAQAMNWVWGILLVAAGGWIIWRTARK